MKLLITGSNGVLGKRFKKAISRYNKYEIVDFKGDITDYNNVKNNICEKNFFDVVVHLASVVPVDEVIRNPAHAFSVNVSGTINLLKALFISKQKPFFLFTSTSHVYASSNKKISENKKTKPISFYGKTKLLSENYIKRKLDNRVNFCIGRIFSTSNINQKRNYLVPDLIRKIRLSK